MNRLLLILFIFSFHSCSTGGKNEIRLFNNLAFILREGEYAAEIDTGIVSKYTGYFNNQDIQIPLFRYIKNDHYEIFIGIPYNTTFEKLALSRLAVYDSSRQNFKSDSSFLYNRYVKDGFIITEYSGEFNNHSIVFISTITSDAGFSDSLFNEAALRNRIKQTKKNEPRL
ncbi:MAG TPA: hypothetical protein VI583_15125 [Cyclobacteriaceae bacterium]|nr:hypothetical protein [Cyclobacteriaceae bacterium]